MRVAKQIFNRSLSLVSQQIRWLIYYFTHRLYNPPKVNTDILQTITQYFCLRQTNFRLSLEHLNNQKLWRYKKNLASLALAIVVLFGVFQSTILAAPDLSDTWTLDTPSEYIYDSGIELDSGVARLKAQNYDTDAETRALYHFDEIVGTTASDSSGQSNNATISNGSFVTGNLNNALNFDGQTTFGSVADHSSLRLGQQHTIEAWAQLDTPLSAGSHHTKLPIVDKGDYQLYFDNETGKIVYEIANNNLGNWVQQGGNETKASWDLNGKRSVTAVDHSTSHVFVGTGNQTAGDAEVWQWDKIASTWLKIGGDGLNNSWSAYTYEEVNSMAVHGNNLFVGLGNSTGDAEVWHWDSATWTKIGGNNVNSSWDGAKERVLSMTADADNIYFGLGTNATTDAHVWRWNLTTETWTRIGGQNLNGGWNTGPEGVYSLIHAGGNLYAGLGTTTTTDAQVWQWNGATWTKIGGNGDNGSWNTGPEAVLSLASDGSNLYAGLGTTTTTDAQVWQWNGATWTKIGGNGDNGSWNTGPEAVRSMIWSGGNLYAGLGDNGTDAQLWRWDGATWLQLAGSGGPTSWTTHMQILDFAIDGSDIYAGLSATSVGGQLYRFQSATWEPIGGNYLNDSWGFYGLESVERMTTSSGKLYAGTGNSAGGDALVWEFDGNTWDLIGGQGINSSWAPNTYELITSMTSFQGDLYVGLGSTAGDGRVWRWDGSSWAEVGGGGLGWGTGPYNTGIERVMSMATDQNYLYVGLGLTNNTDSMVWRWNGSVWSQIGGRTPGSATVLNSSWPANIEGVYSLVSDGVNLYAGLGNSQGDADVWRWDGSTWDQIGGDEENGSWSINTYEYVENLHIHNGNLYAGLGVTTGDAEVWRWDGSTWEFIGGDGINNSWDDATYERVRSMATYNGSLYVGLGSGIGDGEVWRWDESALEWTKIGGNSVNGGWANQIEEVHSLTAFQGKLFASLGFTINADASVYSIGDNGYLESSVDTQTTDWQHIAATYDGTTMRLYRNGLTVGSQTKPLIVRQNNTPLLVGTSYGAHGTTKQQGYFQGRIDEIRLSAAARTNFNTSPYSDEHLTLSPITSARTAGIQQWDSFSHTDIPSGGSITYRLSSDNGVSWLYWDGFGWTESSTVTQANTANVIDVNISTFPITFYGMRWQAIFKGDGTQQVTLDGVSAESTSDTTTPSSNPTSIIANKTNGGSSLLSNDWTNGASPYFAWTEGTDDDAGVYGYCAYLGTDGSADPTTTKGILGTSLAYSGGSCPFVIGTTQLDLATPGILSSALVSSNSPYYLSLRTIDRAGNITATSEQFSFRFDNTPPANPAFITAPSGFINTKDVTLSWQTVGGSAPADTHSGVTGLQYRIGLNGMWYGDNHTGSGDSSDLLLNDGEYSTIPTPDHNDLIEGINTVYFRTWDVAGNYTTNYVTATLKINTSGAPSEPNNLVATPSTNTVNSFGFDWETPTTYIGDPDNITYCYTVNTLPSIFSCAFTGAGSTELTVGAYATQPGSNTLYIVARDESSNINYSNYASVSFTANTPSPGFPLNTDIVDVSIKNTSNWRLALTWDPPSSSGIGISNYKVLRSTNNTIFSEVGTSSSTTYIDAGLSQQTYYYKIQACDSTNNCGAAGSTVSSLPTGKFTTAAALISGPEVSEITTKRATISWVTDRKSDSKISIGTSSGQYSPSEIGNSDQVSDHSISIDNLSPGTTYYIRAKWTDEDGNTGTSQEQTFTTAPAPTIKEVQVINIGLNSATVEFSTKGAFQSAVYYGTSESFGGLKKINTSKNESRYQVAIDGLTDGTKHFFMVSATDDEGVEYRGNIDSFVTPARPRISNLRFQPVEGEPTSTQRVSWDTNVPSTSQVTYAVVNGTAIEIQDSALKTQHEIIIRNLRDDSEYTLVASSRDANGVQAVSDRQAFRTALDTRPPKISDVVIESSIRGSGSEARGQIVISWQTDEPSTSQVAFTEGSGAITFNNKSAEDSQLTTEHIVIISDLPTSRVFSVQPLSKDTAGNEGTGTIETAIIGRASDNALTVVFNTLKTIFGF